MFLVLKDQKNEIERVVLRQTINKDFLSLYIKEETKAEVQNILDNTSDDNKWKALRWLRYGHRAHTPFEQFTYYWLTFERLVGESDITITCQDCGAKRNYRSLDKQKAFQEMQRHDHTITSKEFEEFWKYRQKIFHGGQKPTLAFARELKPVAAKIGIIVENMLESDFHISRRVSVPHAASKITHHNFGYYKFNAEDPTVSFARNYPSQESLEAFREEHSIESSDGYEVLNADEYIKW